ncbi:FAD-binding protein [bacterium]|nr:FAD-binding protein [bacterium]
MPYSPRVHHRLVERLGRERVLVSPEELLTYSYDATPMLGHRPEAVAIVKNADEVAFVHRLANEELCPLVPRGSGTGLSGGSVPVPGSVVLLMTHMNRILEIDSRNLTATVEPGVITGVLQAEVEKLGLFYPPDPGSARICTLGGNVAENAGGLRGLKYGVTKNYVMGMEVVLPTGELLKLGGKCVKDVAGYNLSDFLVGSEGLLGTFTQFTLKLLPKPEARKTMLAVYDSISDAAETVSDIIAAHILPCTLEFLDQMTVRCVEESFQLGLLTDCGALLLIEVDGRQPVVEEDARTIMDICRKRHARSLSLAGGEDEAEGLRAARRAAFSALARARPTCILEDVTVPRSEVAPMVEVVRRIAKEEDLLIANFGHAGDGNLHPTCLTDERNESEIERVHRAFTAIFHAAVRMGGTITGEHGVGIAKKPFLECVAGPEGLELMKKLKATLDPNAILNPGKMFEAKPRREGPLPGEGRAEPRRAQR